jgi:ribosomal protein S12
LNLAKRRATVPRYSNRETSRPSTKCGKGVPLGLSWFGTFSQHWVFIQLQTLETKSPNSGIRTPCNIQKRNGRDLLK